LKTNNSVKVFETNNSYHNIQVLIQSTKTKEHNNEDKKNINQRKKNEMGLKIKKSF